MLGACAAVLVGAFLTVPASGQPASGDVTVTLSTAKQRFDKSTDVTVTVVIANDGATDAQVLSWLTPADGIQAPIFDVSRNGTPATYLGILAKRPAPTAHDYLALPAGASLEYDVNLSDAYSFAKSGDYTIGYSLTDPQLLGYRARTSGQLSSDSLTLAVEGRPEPSVRAIPDTAGGLSYTNCDGQQQSDLDIAFACAAEYAADAFEYLRHERAGPRFQLWFGAFNTSRWQTVKSHYSLIRSATESAPVAFECDSNSPYYAYVFPRQPYRIYLGSAFWTAPMVGTDSKSGTLIHELSHFTVLGGTNDYAYGQTGAINLALANPAQAIMNADSREYFVENTQVTSDGSAYLLSATTQNFGEHPVGTASAPREMTLTSTGDADLNIESLTVTPPFIVSADTCSAATMPPVETCTFSVSFEPFAAGDHAGIITISSDAQRATNSIELLGSGTAVPIAEPVPDPVPVEPTPQASPEPTAQPGPVPEAAKTPVAKLRAKSRKSKLRVTVKPVLSPSLQWSFRVQRKSGRTWKTLGKVYQTQGRKHVRVIDLRKGVYRVQIPATDGYRATASNRARLAR